MMPPLPLLLSRLDLRLAHARAWLERRAPAIFILGTVALALALSLLFLSPRLFVFLGEPRTGTYEWDRATHFLAQAEEPLSAPVEPALRWRLAPALLAHVLQLRGNWALIVPWTGLAAALAYLAALGAVRLRDRLDATLLVLLVGTFGCTQAVTMSHGINDGWLLLALLATAFSPGGGIRLAAAFTGPWIDERYLLALPLCFACRHAFPPAGARRSRPFLLPGPEIAGIVPYLCLRCWITLQGDAVSTGFVSSALAMVPTILPFAPLGWWMGARAGWLLAGFAFVAAARSPAPAASRLLAVAAAAGLVAITLLAADLSRSTNLFLPLLCAGAFVAGELVGVHRTRWLLGLVAVNLALPFAMVTYTWIVPILPLPLELLRYFRHA